MSDSLRDQLIAAGYKAPKKEEKKKHASRKNSKKKSAKKTAHSKRRQPGAPAASPAKKNAAQDEAAIAERKRLKAEIKALIEDKKLTEWKGETAYRYLVDAKIRELYVQDEVQTALAARELAITRLNGDTYVVPRETALAIRQINPQWSVFNLEDQETDSSEESDDYSEYQVPDDLKW